MGFGGAIFAVTAATAVSQISQGYAQKAESNYNASILEGQGKLIDVQSDIQNGQITRQAGQTLSTSIADVAKQGTGLSGSAMAVMLNTQKQYEIDKAISKLNFSMDKNYVNAQADAQRRAGSAAVRSGYTSAFSSLLQGASSYAMYKIPKGGTTTFDANTKQPLEAFGGGTAPYTLPKMSIFR